MKAIYTFILLLFLSAVAIGQGTPGTVRFPTNLDTTDSLIQAANLAATTLNGAIDASQTTITVVDTSLFPSSGILTVQSEYMIYTGKTSTTFTGLTRGAFSSTAAAHASSTAVRMNILAQHHNTLASAVIATETKVGSGSDTPANNEFFMGTGSGTSAWQTATTATAALSNFVGDSGSGGTKGLVPAPAAGDAAAAKFLKADGTWATTGSSGANTALSNLASVAINTALLPGSTDTIDIGSSSLFFRNQFLSSYSDWKRISAPSNPSSGNLRLFANNSTGKLACLDNSGADCMPTAGGSPAWSSITNPSGNLSLTMGTNLTTFNWATGTSTNNLFNLTTDNSSNGTGVLLNIGTGTGSTVKPLKIQAATTDALFINASAQVVLGSGANPAHSLTKLLVSGTGTDSSGNSTLRVVASGGFGTGVTMESTSHTWSVINRNTNELGFYYHTGNFAAYLSHSGTDTWKIVSSGSATRFSLDESGVSGGRKYSMRATATADSAGGGNLIVRDETGSTDRWIMDSSGLNSLRGSSSTTNARVNTLAFSHNTTGTAAAGLGTVLRIQGSTTTTNNQDMAAISATWHNASNGNRTAYAAVSTVSNAGSLVDRIVTGPKTTLTDATAVNLFEIALPTFTSAGGVIEATIVANDGSEIQTRSTVVRYSAVNKGGTYTTEIVEVDSGASPSAGTLDDVWDILTGTNKITIRLNADTSLSSPSVFFVTYTVKNNSEQAITVL